MKRSIVPNLISKDLRLQRLQIILTVGAGLAALLVILRGGEVPIVLGAVWFFVALIVLASMIPMASIVNERKKQHIAFLMSLPVSPIQYTTAKMVSTLGSFLVPWLFLSAVAVCAVLTQHILPYGTLPIVCILALFPLIGFVFISGMALVGESEGWGMVAMLLCNSSYGLAWYLIARIPEVSSNWKSDTPVWNATVLHILGTEVVSIVALVALTFFIQSRKRNFI